MKVLFKTADCRTEKNFFCNSRRWDWKILKRIYAGGHVQVILRSFNFTLLNELLLLNYSTVDLQCCANLCCTAEWLSLSYTHRYILFKYSFSWWFVPGYWGSSLCFTVGPCCLSILYVMVCIYHPLTPSASFPLPPRNHKSVLCICEFCFGWVISWNVFHRMLVLEYVNMSKASSGKSQLTLGEALNTLICIVIL